MQAIIDPHPTRHDLALQNFACAQGGAVKTKVLSLKPGAPPPELAA
jgi:predicted outer membrane repeat protein